MTVISFLMCIIIINIIYDRVYKTLTAKNEKLGSKWSQGRFHNNESSDAFDFFPLYADLF